MKADYYQTWLTKLRKRAHVSGAVSQWAVALTQKLGGDEELWREHLREILEGGEKATLDLILELDLITAPPQMKMTTSDQAELF